MKQTLIKYPNGFRAVLCSKQTNTFSISTSILFGAEQEKKNMSGITHFIERILVSSISKDVARIGGIVDSKTDYEHMEITISSVRENLVKVVDTLTKILFDFRPTYEKFKEERIKVLQEIENRKNSPLAILSELTQKNRYKTTSLATEMIGTTKSIMSLTVEDLREYYNSILSPENLIVSIVGNISNEKEADTLDADTESVNYYDDNKTATDLKNISTWNEIKEDEKEIDKIVLKKYDQDNLNYIKDLVTKEIYARTINLKRAPRRRTTAYFPLKQTTIIKKNKNLNQSRFQISFPSAPYSSTAYRYSKLFEIYLKNYLTKGLSGISGVYGLDIYVSQFKNNAHLNIVFAVDYEKAEEVYKKVIDLLEGQKQESTTTDEFNSVVLAYKTLISLGHEKISDLAKRYNKWLFLKGELFNLTHELKAISAMNYNSFRSVSKKILNFDSMLVVYLGKPLEANALKIK